MTTLTIHVPNEETEKIIGFVESLGGEIVSSEQTKEELRQEIKEAIAEMKLIKTGKKQARNAKEFLNAL